MPLKSQPPYPLPPRDGLSRKRLHTGSVECALPVSRQKSKKLPYAVDMAIVSGSKARASRWKYRVGRSAARPERQCHRQEAGERAADRADCRRRLATTMLRTAQCCRCRSDGATKSRSDKVVRLGCDEPITSRAGDRNGREVFLNLWLRWLG